MGGETFDGERRWSGVLFPGWQKAFAGGVYHRWAKATS